MKRPVFIIIGVIMVFVLLAVWVYILFFNNPNPDAGTYTDLNPGDIVDVNVPPPDTEEPVVDVTGPERLRQLTTKPTAGHQEVQLDASSTPAVYYIEAGTGHIFSIDLQTGAEERISGTTVANAHTGVITPDGQFVLLKSGTGASSPALVGALSSTSDEMLVIELSEPADNLAVTDNNQFLYTTQTNSSLIGKLYNPLNNTTENLFTVPFREAVVGWGTMADDRHLVYPKANSLLEGFVYEVAEGTLYRLPIDGFGLSAAGNESMIIYGRRVGESYQNSIYNRLTDFNSSLVINLLPDKCTAIKNTLDLVCAGGVNLLDTNTPDTWYEGATTYTDNLWRIEPAGSIQLLVDITVETGQTLDITNLNTSNQNLYFTNKHNRTLWLFEIVPSGI